MSAGAKLWAIAVTQKLAGGDRKHRCSHWIVLAETAVDAEKKILDERYEFKRDSVIKVRSCEYVGTMINIGFTLVSAEEANK